MAEIVSMNQKKVVKNIKAAGEKCAAAIQDKEWVEWKFEQQLDEISLKEAQIKSLQISNSDLKELDQERERWLKNDSKDTALARYSRNDERFSYNQET